MPALSFDLHYGYIGNSTPYPRQRWTRFTIHASLNPPAGDTYWAKYRGVTSKASRRKQEEK